MHLHTVGSYFVSNAVHVHNHLLDILISRLGTYKAGWYAARVFHYK